MRGQLAVNRYLLDPATCLPLTLAMLSVAVAVGGHTARQWLDYDRIGLAAGQYWRLLSGHLVHLGGWHLLLNLSGLLMFWWWGSERLPGWRGWLTSIGCALGISCGLLLWQPNVNWYVGLSGVLHGLFAAVAVLALRDRAYSDGLWLVPLLIKVAWELKYGPLPGATAATGGQVVVTAHAYGVGAGMLLGAVLPLVDWTDGDAGSPSG